MPDEQHAFTVQLKCSHCGQVGHLVWHQTDASFQALGIERRLAHVSIGFHPELGRTRSGEPLIICTRCDQIQDAEGL